VSKGFTKITVSCLATEFSEDTENFLDTGFTQDLHGFKLGHRDFLDRMTGFFRLDGG